MSLFILSTAWHMRYTGCQRETGDYLKTYESFFIWKISKTTARFPSIIGPMSWDHRLFFRNLIGHPTKSLLFRTVRRKVLQEARDSNLGVAVNLQLPGDRNGRLPNRWERENQSYNPWFDVITGSWREKSARDEEGVISRLGHLNSLGRLGSLDPLGALRSLSSAFRGFFKRSGRNNASLAALVYANTPRMHLDCTLHAPVSRSHKISRLPRFAFARFPLSGRGWLRCVMNNEPRTLAR